MRALILGIGGLRGAYDAGVAAALCRKLGNTYFDAIYATSVGVFAATFYAANQPDVIENTWRNYVCGNQLVNYRNPFYGRNILDTEYLIDLFKSDKSLLDKNEIFASGVKIQYAVEKLESGKAEYMTPTKENIFDLMLAATAVPIIHKPVILNGDKYIDGSLVDPIPIKKAIADGCDEIVVIYNKPKGFYVSSEYTLVSKVVPLFFSKIIGSQIKGLESLYRNLEDTLEKENPLVIRPREKVNFSILNTNKQVINKLVDMGLKDGYAAAEQILLRDVGK